MASQSVSFWLKLIKFNTRTKRPFIQPLDHLCPPICLSVCLSSSSWSRFVIKSHITTLTTDPLNSSPSLLLLPYKQATSHATPQQQQWQLLEMWWTVDKLMARGAGLSGVGRGEEDSMTEQATLRASLKYKGGSGVGDGRVGRGIAAWGLGVLQELEQHSVAVAGVL